MIVTREQMLAADRWSEKMYPGSTLRTIEWLERRLAEIEKAKPHSYGADLVYQCHSMKLNEMAGMKGVGPD